MTRASRIVFFSTSKLEQSRKTAEKLSHRIVQYVRRIIPKMRIEVDEDRERGEGEDVRRYQKTNLMKLSGASSL